GLSRYLFNTAIDRGHIATGWAWDADFFDADNDGDDDLYCVNGLNEYKIFQATMRKTLEDGTSRTWTYSVNEKEPNVLFLNEDGKLRNRSEGSGADLLVNSRAAAYLDADGDGDLDVVINNYQEQASFLENRSDRRGNNWIRIELVGDPERGNNRDAVGATIIATTPSGRTIWRAVQAGTGYLSDHPKVQHLGLGSEESVELKVVWPNGETSEHRALEPNRLHVISQIEESPTRLAEPEGDDASATAVNGF
ncbi:MAG: ASPIC/UnbV domain-containing protein, partial [Acidobacteria bacterium]|nr:ASPIC/UnbV domain-containing protein [Acidobacteriota bacterium]